MRVSRSIVAPLAIVVAVLLSLAVATVAMAGGRPLTTSLSGAEEVSSATGQLGAGDPDGTGFASLTLNAGQEEVCFDVQVANVSDILFAHIHENVAGQNGPVVVTLFHFGPAAPSRDRHFTGCVSAPREQIVEILSNVSGYYVNVHSTEFPPGAVRGQLGD